MFVNIYTFYQAVIIAAVIQAVKGTKLGILYECKIILGIIRNS